MKGILGALPSPATSEIVIGPLHLRAYGLAIALGVIAAVALARKRWAALDHDPDEISGMALWAVPAGLVGARLYHVVTDYQRYEGRWGEAVQIWNGGLGIPGGLLAGTLVGVWYARRHQMPLAELIDATIPAVPLAQAIGRLGNWFNQELFGRPTSLPWGLEIDATKRPQGFEAFSTFHPTFLYEALWNLALCGLLVWLDRRRLLPRGSLLWVYVGGYFTGRLWIESLRIDPASLILGVRVNIWVSVAAVAFSGLVIARQVRRRETAGAPLDGSAPHAR
mgnify:CR=1 FL=1